MGTSTLVWARRGRSFPARQATYWNSRARWVISTVTTSSTSAITVSGGRASGRRTAAIRLTSTATASWTSVTTGSGAIVPEIYEAIAAEVGRVATIRGAEVL